MNVSKNFLLPTSHRIIGVTGKCLDIMGVIISEIKFNKVTNNVVYVCDNVKGLFLSVKAQIELGLLPDGYPNVDCLSSISISTLENLNSCTLLAECGCRLRTPPPERPGKLPFPSTTENVNKLEKWIVDRYSASAFNSCVHQPLPKMTGRPLDIHFKENVIPNAVHTPIPIPHHWKKKLSKTSTGTLI